MSGKSAVLSPAACGQNPVQVRFLLRHTQMDESVFMLTEDMLPQVCGVMVDEECAPLIAYRRDEIAYQERAVTEMEKFFRAATGKSET